ncbi:hypothetical protein ACHHYP_09135 [Achlya hypogyna]|uniref:Transmembrane protein n=1 Tax=Achlya hypogyna TaxID=1202772 RepID=A0A1V9YNQ8_ACHHY|nr:hypothetical protein ACHHYP_09135 [Achlya hypogyna]
MSDLRLGFPALPGPGRVLPLPAAAVTATPPGRTPSKVEAAVGLGYMVLSILSGIYYVLLLSRSFANDLWWDGYNLSGHEAFLIDVANKMLSPAHPNGAIVDILSPLATTRKLYTSPDASTEVYSTYARHLVLAELQSLSYAVTNLRKLTPAWALRMNSQQCWVDFNRTFEVAHTLARQARCTTKYIANAAVYHEAILRNQAWSAFIGFWGGAGTSFTIGLLSPLQATAPGRVWLAQTAAALTTYSVDDEVAYWTKTGGVTHFKLQWQDRTQTGIAESFVIENALGMQHSFEIKTVQAAAGPWASELLYWQPLNDLWAMWVFNASLIRSSTNWFGRNFTANSIERINGNTNAHGAFDPVSQLFRDVLGPFVSVDVFYIPPPPALVAVYDALRTTVALTLASNPTALAPYEALGTAATTVQPTPPAWQAVDLVFYGGSPMCPWNSGTTYVQDAMSFLDSCVSTSPFSVSLAEPDKLLFAFLFGAPAVTDVCALSATSTGCVAALQDAVALYDKIQIPASTLALASAATTAVAQIHPSIMQFTANANQSHWSLLLQPLVDDSVAWSFYGYVMLYDWALGRREVLQLDGDVSTMVLISSELDAQKVPTTGGAGYVERATVVIVYLIAATSAILAGVGVLCLAYAFSGPVVGRNLFFFNRVVGTTWVGRPLLCLRGASAVCLLSTASLELVHRGGFSRLVLAPRSFWASVVVAGEATWITLVLHDVVLVADATSTARLGPVCSCALWAAILLIDLVAPVEPVGRVARSCSSTNMDYAVACSSAVVALGSTSRVWVLLGLQVAVVVGGYVVGRCTSRRSSAHHTKTLLLSGAAHTFLTPLPGSSDGLVVLDNISCVLTGLLPTAFDGRKYLFDMPLWLFVDNSVPMAHGVGLRSPVFEGSKRRASTRRGSAQRRAAAAVSWLAAVGGFAYILCSIASSISYVQVTAVDMANNIFWSTFNMTGTGAFVGNWLNEQLVLGVAPGPVALHTPSVQLPSFFGATTARITAPANFGAALQHTRLTSLKAAIAGLRVTDACATPWISTAYCYVDFNRTWDLAHSAARQARCASGTTNGAVYLESLLRNVHWDEWCVCWGNVFDVAIGQSLATTISGREFLASVEVRVPLASEVSYWAAAGLTAYDVQWQNYKRLGIDNSYAILNAYGVAYTLTLQSLNGAYRVPRQTSFKMHWGLANDLAAIASNTSGIGGRSLVRGSANYAFANTTMQAVLMANGTLASPLPEAFGILSTIALGPFGTIDMIYVSVPPRLAAFLRNLLDSLRTTLAGSLATQAAYFNITPLAASYPLPLAWYDPHPLGYGGSPLCPGAARAAGSKLNGPRQFFSFDAPCSTGAPVSALLEPSREAYVFMATMARLSDLQTVCPNDPYNRGACIGGYPLRLAAFVQSYLPPVDPASVARLANAIEALDIRAMVWASLNATSPMLLWTTNIVGAADTTYAFFGWNYIFDWGMGRREVVRFAGDVGQLTLVSELQTPHGEDVLAWQVPTNIAQYFRAGVFYVTYVMIAVATAAGVYIVVSRGHIQGINMLELARVGGHVWVGRPFLFLRSVTALTLLSTSTLELQYSGYVSSLSLVALPWYKTLLAASEVTWLVAVVNDVMMVVTRSYTAVYATPNSVLVWVIVAALTAVDPVMPRTTIEARCDLAQMDLQVTCSSATIEIGQSTRLWTLVGIVLGCNVLCYALTRCYYRSNAPACEATSLLLSSGAKHLFLHSNRTFDDTYYLDRASAAINGMLTLSHRGHIYALDFKLWRFLVFQEPSGIPDTEAHAAAWRHGVPLTD